MPVPTLISDLSVTIASNSPAGADNASTMDDYLRAHAAFIAQLQASKAPLVSPALTGTPTHGGIEIGYRSIPSVATVGGDAAVTERGKCYAATGNIGVQNSVFSAGDSFSIYNNSASAITITQGSGVTLRWGGTTTTGSRTLAPRGMATIWFVSASEAVVVGAGVS